MTYEENPLEIAKAFLRNAPPGEYEQCTLALRSIVHSDELIDQARAETQQEWNEKECVVVEIDDHKGIICPEACVQTGKYIDPIAQEIFDYDYECRVFTKTGQKVQCSDFRNQLQEELSRYCLMAYKQDAAAGVYDCQDGSINIVLRSRSVSLMNFRTGKTIGRYNLSPDGSLIGTISSIQHFFERGNAVCQHDGHCNKTVTFGNAKEVVKAIKAFEDEWLDGYKNTLESIGADVLFKLRRKMPISKTKINWEREITVGGGMQI